MAPTTNRKDLLRQIVTAKLVNYDNLINHMQHMDTPSMHHHMRMMIQNHTYDSVYLVGLAWCGVLWAASTGSSDRRTTVSNSIDAFELGVEGKTTTIRAEARQDKFAACQRSSLYYIAGQNIPRNLELGSPTPPSAFPKSCRFWLLFVPVDQASPGKSKIGWICVSRPNRPNFLLKWEKAMDNSLTIEYLIIKLLVNS